MSQRQGISRLLLTAADIFALEAMTGGETHCSFWAERLHQANCERSICSERYGLASQTRDEEGSICFEL